MAPTSVWSPAAHPAPAWATTAALAYVATAQAAVGTQVFAIVRDKRVAMTVTTLLFSPTATTAWLISITAERYSRPFGKTNNFNHLDVHHDHQVHARPRMAANQL